MRYINFLIYFLTCCYCGQAQSYVPSYVTCSMTACDVLFTVRQEIADNRQLWEMKEKLGRVTSMEHKFEDISIEFDKMYYEFSQFKDEFKKFMENYNKNKPEASTLLHKIVNREQSDTKESSHEERLKKIEDKLEKSLDNIQEIKLLKSEIGELKKEIESEKHKNELKIKENAQQIIEFQKENSIKINEFYDELTESNNEVARKILQLHNNVTTDIQNQLNEHINNTSADIIGLEEQMEDLLNKTTEDITHFKMSVLTNSSINSVKVDDKFSQVSDQIEFFHQHVNKSDANEKQNVLDIETIANYSHQIEADLEETEIKLSQLEKEMEMNSNLTSKLVAQVNEIKIETNNNTQSKKQILITLHDLNKNYKEMNEKLQKIYKNSNSMSENNRLLKDEESDNTNTFLHPSYITSGSSLASCRYIKEGDINVVASLDGRPITATVYAVPHGKIVEYRCKDPGTFRIDPKSFRQCLDGKWTNTVHTCGQLGSLHNKQENFIKYEFEELAPAITIEPKPDTDSTGILPNGTFIIRPGSKFILGCHVTDLKKNIQLSVSRITSLQPEIINAKLNDGGSKYQIEIIDAKESDSGNYTCKNRQDSSSHTVQVMVRDVLCPLLPTEKGLRSVKKINRHMNSELQLQCIQLNHILDWPPESADDGTSKITCLPSGQWSSDWPDCKLRSK